MPVIWEALRLVSQIFSILNVMYISNIERFFIYLF